MDLWLVRHGDAVSERVDPARPLSPEGVRAVSETARFLAETLGPIDLVAASGKVRALQTAAIFAEAAGYPAERIVKTAVLSPAASPADFVAFLGECGELGRVMCVGHLPSIAGFASYFLVPEGAVRLVFGAGTVCRIRVETLRPGEGELLLLF